MTTKYETMTVKELRVTAKELNIVGIYKMKKDSLISAIETSTEDAPAENTSTSTSVIEPAENTSTSTSLFINDAPADSEFKTIGSKTHNVLWDVAMNQKVSLVKLSMSDSIDLLENNSKELKTSEVVKSFNDFKEAVQYLRDEDLGDRWWAARSLTSHEPMTNGVKLTEPVTSKLVEKYSSRMHFEDNGTYILIYAK